jgi:hypothetical protein
MPLALVGLAGFDYLLERVENAAFYYPRVPLQQALANDVAIQLLRSLVVQRPDEVHDFALLIAHRLKYLHHI